ncbi:unnamed protein product [Miscanthus lutarioriparius]|uniref:Uncharacterized protein n=1 Tax=Miscanthus lutarioriparius TaxID=422564 RepID=A0A811RK57_9POAL|nr:unnamed protein product [Miscanthus lutarioriparius]
MTSAAQVSSHGTRALGARSIASPRPASSSSSPPHPLARSRLVLARLGFSSPDLVVATRIWAGPRRIELILAGFGGGRHHVLHAASSSAPEERRRSPGSPTAFAPGRAGEDSVAGAASARSSGSAKDAAAVAQKDQGADKPSSAAAESSKRRKEPEQQQPAAPWAKLLSQCSQALRRMQRVGMRLNVSAYTVAIKTYGLPVSFSTMSSSNVFKASLWRRLIAKALQARRFGRRLASNSYGVRKTSLWRPILPRSSKAGAIRDARGGKTRERGRRDGGKEQSRAQRLGARGERSAGEIREQREERSRGRRTYLLARVNAFARAAGRSCCRHYDMKHGIVNGLLYINLQKFHRCDVQNSPGSTQQLWITTGGPAMFSNISGNEESKSLCLKKNHWWSRTSKMMVVSRSAMYATCL